MSSPDAGDTSRKAARILVVEDVDFNRVILTGILAERGWQTVTAASGEAALDILAQDPGFQIILMDIGLPGIDGLEATRRIKENPEVCAIPVIALTAETAGNNEHSSAAGFAEYLEKNFDPEPLFAAIEKHLCPAGGRNRRTAGPLVANPPEPADLDFNALLATYADEATLSRIATAFFADTGKELLLLEQALAAENQKAILACCHSLKGSSTIFTAKNLLAATQELETCIRDEKSDASGSAWRKVLAAYESLRGAVKKRLGLP